MAVAGARAGSRTASRAGHATTPAVPSADGRAGALRVRQAARRTVTGCPAGSAGVVPSGFLAGAAFMALHLVRRQHAYIGPVPDRRDGCRRPSACLATKWIGMVVHAVLAVLFGSLFAAALAPLRRRSAGWFAWAGLLFGGVVYVVDFQILARNVGYFSAVLETTNQPSSWLRISCSRCACGAAPARQAPSDRSGRSPDAGVPSAAVCWVVGAGRLPSSRRIQGDERQLRPFAAALQGTRRTAIPAARTAPVSRPARLSGCAARSRRGR